MDVDVYYKKITMYMSVVANDVDMSTVNQITMYMSTVDQKEKLGAYAVRDLSIPSPTVVPHWLGYVDMSNTVLDYDNT